MAFDASQKSSIARGIAEWLSSKDWQDPAVAEEIVERSLGDEGRWDHGSVSFALKSAKKQGDNFEIEGTLGFRAIWQADQGPTDLSAKCKLGVKVPNPDDPSPSVSFVWLKGGL